MIELQDFAFERPRKAAPPFRLGPINLCVEPGSQWALLGKNGVGKTSFALALIGGIKKISGEVLVDGHKLARHPQMRSEIGAVFREPLLFDTLTIGENLRFSPKAKAEKELQALSERFELQHLLQASPHQLSSGQQQRVALARALAAKPRLLILDEPYETIAASERAPLAASIREYCREQEIALITISHEPRDLGLIADSIAFFDGDANAPINLKAVGSMKRLRRKPSCLALAEVLMVPTLFMQAGDRLPQAVYTDFHDSPHQPSCGRLVGLRRVQPDRRDSHWAELLGPSALGQGYLFRFQGGIIELKHAEIASADAAPRWDLSASKVGLYIDCSQARIEVVEASVDGADVF